MFRLCFCRKRSFRRPLCGLAFSGHAAVNGKDGDGRNGGDNPACGLARPVPAERLSGPAAEHRAADAEQGGEDEAEFVAAGIEEFRQNADDETDEDGGQHVFSFVWVCTGRQYAARGVDLKCRLQDLMFFDACLHGGRLKGRFERLVIGVRAFSACPNARWTR